MEAVDSLAGVLKCNELKNEVEDERCGIDCCPFEFPWLLVWELMGDLCVLDLSKFSETV